MAAGVSGDRPPIRLGVIGLGRAFTLMLPSFLADPRIALVAAADPRPEARGRFADELGGRAYETDVALCADPAVQAVYIATPHQFHAGNVAAAAAAGKHILVEKPMGLTLAECQAMVDAARAAGVHLIVGHSHSFDAPIRHARRLIASGEVGALRMISATYYTDFLYRPRRPEELDSAQGGGVVFNQAPHQVDVVRLLGGGMVRSVRALTGAWDARRPTEGAYAALLTFTNGAFASLTYSGYAHFDGDELVGWIAESGQAKDPAGYGAARAELRAVDDPAAELALRASRGYGTQPIAALRPGRQNQHFGLVIASCDAADVRPLPDRVMVYGETLRSDPVPAPAVYRVEVIDELADAVWHGRRPLHDGTWGLATMEACFALRESSITGQDVILHHQVSSND
jgi:phthalate 4,5-cis-dihydrodiol dehydrogenase